MDQFPQHDMFLSHCTSLTFDLSFQLIILSLELMQRYKLLCKKKNSLECLNSYVVYLSINKYLVTHIRIILSFRHEINVMKKLKGPEKKNTLEISNSEMTSRNCQSLRDQ